MKFIPDNQQLDKTETKIFDLGHRFFQHAIKFGETSNWEFVPWESLIAGKFFCDYQEVLLEDGRKISKMINKEISRRISILNKKLSCV